MIPKRITRVGETIRAELSAIMLKDIKDPRIGFITITEVAMSPDLKVARVYFSQMGEGEDKEESLCGLRKASGFMRRELGRRLKLKFTPELRFFLDESLETGERISKLLKEIG